ncbi:MAG: hypothetical protein WA125_12935 [Desulfosporosinus sp.]
MKFHRFSLSIDEATYQAIQTRVAASGKSEADVTRELIKRGLASDWIDENTDLIAWVVRQQLEIVLKPHIERLAALSSKSGHMSTTAAFLNVQALMDLVPKEQRKDVRVMYESARKKAAAYMKTKAENWENDIGAE